MTIFLAMRTIPPRQRATLARRIAAGLPVWAAAKGSNLPAAEVGELMGEPEFKDLIGAWATRPDGQPMLPLTPGEPRQREFAFRAGVNIVMYTLTGNYKADQVHVPALLERLGQ